MGTNIKKLGISLLIVIFSGIGLYWYSSAELHPESVVSAESNANSDENEMINDELQAEEDSNSIDKTNSTEDKIVPKSSESTKLNNESLNIKKVEDGTLEQNKGKELTIEEAESLLKQYNSNVDYIYQGDETMFKDVLQDKGYKGYLFLPDVDGDIGFFVDKYNKDIYKFHPSGYMEKI